MSLFIWTYGCIHNQNRTHSVSTSVLFTFQKTVTHNTSSRIELDSNNCVVGLVVLDKIMRMEESKVLRQCLS